MTLGTLYHSGHVLLLAKAAYERSAKLSSESEVCIALSAAAFEGFLNELAHMFRNHEEPESAVALAEVLAEAEDARVSPITKFRLAAFALSGRFPRRDDLTIQRLSALMRLRNSLMHLRPDPVFTLDETYEHQVKNLKPPTEVALLVSEGVVSLPKKYSGSWRQLMSTQEVARWGYNSSVSAMLWLTDAASDPVVEERMRFMTDHLPKL